MKRVGIITLFHNSLNYGGLLQAYALCRKIEKMGYNVEQISYDAAAGYSILHKIKQLFFKFIYVFLNLKNAGEEKKLRKGLAERKKKIRIFSERFISHSETTYTGKTINKANDEYDIFVAGSDQIWSKYSPVYTLDFVSKDKRKISYAASIGKKNLDDETKRLFKKSLETFSNVSVREKEAVEIIEGFLSHKVSWVLDPTMLLLKEEWDEICTERRIEYPYLFCYFLGSDIRLRELAKRYAEEKRLKIVCLPHLHSKLENNDVGFGDIQLYDVSPADFISLIKHAEVVFTDSFHASVFSGIYKKNFFVFDRVSAKGMNTRIYSLCELYQCEEHFCDNEERFSLEYIRNLDSIDYCYESEQFKKLKNISEEFLKNSLKED